MKAWSAEEDAAFLAAVGEAPSLNGDHPEQPASIGSAPTDALAAARVDLVEIIRAGLPERQYVPGGKPWLISSKRYLLPASAGTGKSLAALVIAVEVVDNGGTVAVLDVENGAEEYAARLADILADRDPRLADECSARLRYYAWPALQRDWGPDEWAAPLQGVDLVIFDSSRLTLSLAGWAEDSNDDYAEFVNGRLVPLARAGTSTIVLDNTGHEERDRARGASAKQDLNEVVYVAKVGRPFDRDQTGELHLHRKRTRFADLPLQLTMTLGGGTYRAPVVAEQDDSAFRPTALMEKTSKVIEESPGLNRKAVLALVGGKREWSGTALGLLVAEGSVRAEQDGREKKHYSERPYREADDDA